MSLINVPLKWCYLRDVFLPNKRILNPEDFFHFSFCTTVQWCDELGSDLLILFRSLPQFNHFPISWCIQWSPVVWKGHNKRHDLYRWPLRTITDRKAKQKKIEKCFSRKCCCTIRLYLSIYGIYTAILQDKLSEALPCPVKKESLE